MSATYSEREMRRRRRQHWRTQSVRLRRGVAANARRFSVAAGRWVVAFAARLRVGSAFAALLFARRAARRRGDRARAYGIAYGIPDADARARLRVLAGRLGDPASPPSVEGSVPAASAGFDSVVSKAA